MQLMRMMNKRRDNDLLQDVQDHEGYSPLAVAMRADVVSYPYLSFSPLIDKSFDYDREEYTFIHDYVTDRFNVILSFYNEGEEEAFKAFYWQSEDLLNFTAVPKPFDLQAESKYIMTDPENKGHIISREEDAKHFTLVVSDEESGKETSRLTFKKENKEDTNNTIYKVGYDTTRVNYDKFVLMVHCQPINKDSGCLDCLSFLVCRIGADGKIHAQFVEGLNELLPDIERGTYRQLIGQDTAYDFEDQKITKEEDTDRAILPACCLLDMFFEPAEENREQWPRKIFIYGFRSVVDDYAHDDVTFTLNLEKRICFIETRIVEDGIQEVPFTLTEEAGLLHVQILVDQSRFCLLINAMDESIGGDSVKFDFCTIKSLLSKRWIVKASEQVQAEIQVRIPQEFPDCS